MLDSLFYQSSPLVTFAILFIAMVIFMKIGMAMAARKVRDLPDASEGAMNEIDGWMLGLLALLMSFTFNLASLRYDTRREIIVEEANDISTAVLRADLYPDSLRQILRKDFKEYIDERIEYFNIYMDKEKYKNSLAKSNEISSRLWKRVSEYSVQPNASFVVSNQMIPALNQMIDIVTTRDSARSAHVPAFVLSLLFFLCIISSFVAGYRISSGIDWLSIASLCLMVSISFYMILDLDNPKGRINLDEPQQKMIELRQMFEK